MAAVGSLSCTWRKYNPNFYSHQPEEKAKTISNATKFSKETKFIIKFTEQKPVRGSFYNGKSTIWVPGSPDLPLPSQEVHGLALVPHWCQQGHQNQSRHYSWNHHVQWREKSQWPNQCLERKKLDLDDSLAAFQFNKDNWVASKDSFLQLFGPKHSARTICSNFKDLT